MSWQPFQYFLSIPDTMMNSWPLLPPVMIQFLMRKSEGKRMGPEDFPGSSSTKIICDFVLQTYREKEQICHLKNLSLPGVVFFFNYRKTPCFLLKKKNWIIQEVRKISKKKSAKFLPSKPILFWCLFSKDFITKSLPVAFCPFLLPSFVTYLGLPAALHYCHHPHTSRVLWSSIGTWPPRGSPSARLL